MESPPSPYAQITARRILFVGMVTSAFALIVSIGGNTTLGLQICGGGVVIALILFILGGLAVAANKDEPPAE